MANPVLTLGVAAGAALCLVLGANNISICSGLAMSSRAIRYKHAVALAAVGLITGAILEGGKMAGAVSGIAPGAGVEVFLAAVLGTFVVMGLLTLPGLPISLTEVFVGGIAGATVAHAGALNIAFTLRVVISWFLAPIAGLVVAALISLATRILAKATRRVILLNKTYTSLTIVAGFYSSYVLGASGIGLVAGGINVAVGLRPWILLGLAAAGVAGMALFGRATTRSVAENIVGLNMPGAMAAQLAGAFVVHGFTELGIPVSITEAVVGGVFGAAVPRKLVVRNNRLIRRLLLGWTTAPLLCFLLAFGLARFL